MAVPSRSATKAPLARAWIGPCQGAQPLKSAFRVALLRDSRIDWRQAWLDRYELEPYLLLTTIRLGYRHMEVPVTKIYPPHQLGYTKMRPGIDWWSIIRPIVYLGLGLKK